MIPRSTLNALLSQGWSKARQQVCHSAPTELAGFIASPSPANTIRPPSTIRAREPPARGHGHFLLSLSRFLLFLLLVRVAARRGLVFHTLVASTLFLYTSRNRVVVVVVRIRLGYYPSHRWYHFQCSSAGHSSTLSSLPLSFLLHPVFFSRIVHLACASFLRLLNISRWGRVRGTRTQDCSTTKLLLCHV